jgi:hypothetical protein
MDHILKIISCPVCFEEYVASSDHGKYPRMLSCGHGMCTYCCVLLMDKELVRCVYYKFNMCHIIPSSFFFLFFISFFFSFSNNAHSLVSSRLNE